MATMADVARAAGVSLSTVSYALSGVRPVSESTKERIDRAIEELGFRRNAAAASLARRRTDVVAILYPVLDDGITATITQMIVAAEDEARRHGYELVIWPQSDPDVVVEMAREGKADAVLVMEVAIGDERVSRLESARIPVALIGRTNEESTVPFVDVDFEVTMAGAVDALVEHGHRSIIFINRRHRRGHLSYGAAAHASNAFAAAVASHGIDGVEVEVSDSREAGAAILHDICRLDSSVTGLVIMNERAAFGLAAEAQRLGIGIPEDLSVVAVVTSPGTAAHTGPGLSSFDVRADRMGRQAVTYLVESISGDESDSDTPGPKAPRHELVPCEFVDRGSIASPRPTSICARVRAHEGGSNE